MKNKLRFENAFYVGIVCGCWLTYLAPIMGSSELQTALIMTFGMLVLIGVNLRKLVKAMNP